jgi:ubiquinone/menaquinone biosynthesis C-methylase UbiE
MSNDAVSFVGSIPQHYDQGMGPMIFVDYAADIAQRVAAADPARVLETAAGTGIVTRKLRDALPAATRLTATDLNPPMLDIARAEPASRSNSSLPMPWRFPSRMEASMPSCASSA